jgi:hypothetical protein
MKLILKEIKDDDFWMMNKFHLTFLNVFIEKKVICDVQPCRFYSIQNNVNFLHCSLYYEDDQSKYIPILY